MKKLNTVELFSGTKSFSNVAEKLGHNTLTVDNNETLRPDIIADINNFSYWGDPIDVLWCSPPCTCFSIASCSHYWTKDRRPRNKKTRDALRLLENTIRFIDVNRPKIWFIENPRGIMRKKIDRYFKRYGIQAIRHTVTYCQYGAKIMKPTDIWTNSKTWKPRPMCKNGAPCHERAGRGSKNGVPGLYNPTWENARGGNGIERSKIPSELFYEIFKSI